MFRLPEIRDNCRMCNQINWNNAYHVLAECEVCREERQLFIIKSDENVRRESWLNILSKKAFENVEK